jgi:hypothetical protein
MKRNTTILIVVALIGVLYAVPWLIAVRDVNVIRTQTPSPAGTPEWH